MCSVWKAAVSSSTILRVQYGKLLAAAQPFSMFIMESYWQQLDHSASLLLAVASHLSCQKHLL
jgi:hypothetical protein